jgi:hypothetical protein
MKFQTRIPKNDRILFDKIVSFMLLCEIQSLPTEAREAINDWFKKNTEQDDTNFIMSYADAVLIMEKICQ